MVSIACFVWSASCCARVMVATAIASATIVVAVMIGLMSPSLLRPDRVVAALRERGVKRERLGVEPGGARGGIGPAPSEWQPPRTVPLGIRVCQHDAALSP